MTASTRLAPGAWVRKYEPRELGGRPRRGCRRTMLVSAQSIPYDVAHRSPYCCGDPISGVRSARCSVDGPAGSSVGRVPREQGRPLEPPVPPPGHIALLNRAEPELGQPSVPNTGDDRPVAHIAVRDGSGAVGGAPGRFWSPNTRAPGGSMRPTAASSSSPHASYRLRPPFLNTAFAAEDLLAQARPSLPAPTPPRRPETVTHESPVRSP